MVLCSYVSEFHGVNRPEAQALLKLKLKGLSTACPSAYAEGLVGIGSPYKQTTTFRQSLSRLSFLCLID